MFVPELSRSWLRNQLRYNFLIVLIPTLFSFECTLNPNTFIFPCNMFCLLKYQNFVALTFCACFIMLLLIQLTLAQLMSLISLLPFLHNLLQIILLW